MGCHPESELLGHKTATHETAHGDSGSEVDLRVQRCFGQDSVSDRHSFLPRMPWGAPPPELGRPTGELGWTGVQSREKGFAGSEESWGPHVAGRSPAPLPILGRSCSHTWHVGGEAEDRTGQGTCWQVNLPFCFLRGHLSSEPVPGGMHAN